MSVRTSGIQVAVNSAPVDRDETTNEAGKPAAKAERTDLLHWLMRRIPGDDGNWVLVFLKAIVFFSLFMVMACYAVVVIIFTGLLTLVGLKPNRNSNDFSSRICALVILTLAATTCLGILLVIPSGWLGRAFVIGAGSLSVGLFVISEWIGFALDCLWRRRVRSELLALRPE